MVSHVINNNSYLNKQKLKQARWMAPRATLICQTKVTLPCICFCATKMTLVNPDDRKNQAAEGEPQAAINVRTPKRILHFSDGILEEYSDDEVDNTPKQEQPVVDPATLTWGPWLWYKTWRAGAGTLYVIDSIGEYLASFFGITTPRYYFELEEYKRREGELKKEKEEAKGWSESANAESVQMHDITTNQPKPVDV